MAKEGKTIIARDAANGNRIVSGALAEDFANSVPEGFEDFLEKAEGAPMSLIEAKIEVDHRLVDYLGFDPEAKEDYTLTPKGRVCHLLALGTHTDYRGYSRGTRTSLELITHCRQRGFRYGFGDCTGRLSQRTLDCTAKMIYELGYHGMRLGNVATGKK
uniref:Uncharacterized protein n=1 Tax=Odontella aurita TaxID=265563 RepID=A0A7S4JVW8_9STRA|mmetsp:Transcript_55488/g.166393  ORF Transcript_55488/g.166393 Transcript_55488/m.166393 type:complete len:159 (+) Transcript_55488:230-706(+)